MCTTESRISILILQFRIFDDSKREYFTVNEQTHLKRITGQEKKRVFRERKGGKKRSNFYEGLKVWIDFQKEEEENWVETESSKLLKSYFYIVFREREKLKRYIKTKEKIKKILERKSIEVGEKLNRGRRRKTTAFL